MTTLLTDQAVEKGTYVITLAFFNEDGAAVVPTGATWSLTDRAGAVVNSRSAVSITPLAATATILLQGNDLAVADKRNRARFVTAEWTYNSALGTDLTGKEEIEFYIEELRKVS